MLKFTLERRMRNGIPWGATHFNPHTLLFYRYDHAGVLHVWFGNSDTWVKSRSGEKSLKDLKEMKV
jgi:hypothetical protein